MDTPFLYRLDFGLLFAAFLAILLAAGFAGTLVGRRLRGAAADAPERLGLNGLDNAVLGLLALLVGFTLAMALSRYEDRRTTALNEANAIGTTWLRAQMLPEPARGASDRLLRDYVRLRLDLAGGSESDQSVADFLTQSGRLQQQLWAQAMVAEAALPQPVPTGLYLQALNDTIDLQETRITAGRNHVPGAVFVLLLGVAAVASGFSGYAAGIAGHRRPVAEIITGLLITCVILTIFDLDAPGAGFIRISPQPLLDLAASMGMPAL
jgi:hypothetical protein